jgi:glycosyltransferase involved in cell wall biosynthesis
LTDAARRSAAALSVAIVGDCERPTAYASINRVWAAGLSRLGFEVQLIPDSAALAARGRRFDRVIHHDYAEPFGELRRPGCGRFIGVRTWDFGPYPPRWVEVANSICDELWVPSSWIAEQAAAAGIDPETTFVVPHGVDLELMTPEGAGFDGFGGFDAPTGADPFRFLFVGAAVARKGVDVLLDAYARAFDAGDGVTLVIKDHGGDVFYRGVRLVDAIAAMRARPPWRKTTISAPAVAAVAKVTKWMPPAVERPASGVSLCV